MDCLKTLASGRMAAVVLRSGTVLVTLAMALLTTACVTSGRGDKMESDIKQLQMEMAETRDSLEADRAQLTQMLTRANSNLDNLEKVSKEAADRLARNSADLGAEMIEVKKNLSDLNGQIGLLRRDLEKLQKDYDLFKSDVDSRLGSSEAAAALPNDADSLWDEGKRRFDAKDYDGARMAFEKFTSTFRKDRKADNAQFYLGEAYLKERKYAEAIFAYKTVLEKHKRSDVEDEATYGIGEALLGQGKACDAKIFYEVARDKSRKKAVKRNAGRRIKEISKKNKCK